ncbi:hypothetical protein J7M23_09440, partial [Candidatus Sumerlaeota bacterium]|nr:hypothetical protein [Candidatus Sumerlaeota bacterium]
MMQKPALCVEKSVYICKFTSESITIDGLLSDSGWQKAGVLKFFVPVSGKKPESTTEGRLLWDKQ